MNMGKSYAQLEKAVALLSQKVDNSTSQVERLGEKLDKYIEKHELVIEKMDAKWDSRISVLERFRWVFGGALLVITYIINKLKI